MIGDFDIEKFKFLSDNHKPRMTAKEWERQILNYGFEITDESFKKYRQGKAKPRGAVIYAMAKILGVRYDDLLEEMGIKDKNYAKFITRIESLLNNAHKIDPKDLILIQTMIERIVLDSTKEEKINDWYPTIF